MEKEAVEEPVKQIIKKNENNYSQKVKTAFLLAGITVLLIVVTALVFWFFHKKKLKKKIWSDHRQPQGKQHCNHRNA